MATRVSQFLAVILTALALIPGGAHVLALPSKMAMPETPYFVVQQTYRGWAWLGAVLFAAILVNWLSAFLARDRGRSSLLSLAAGLLIAGTLVIFFIWTYPANAATGNWTTVTEDWQSLRLQWEYSHAVNAAVTFLALLCAAGAMLPAAPRHTFTEPPPSADGIRQI